MREAGGPNTPELVIVTGMCPAHRGTHARTTDDLAQRFWKGAERGLCGMGMEVQSRYLRCYLIPSEKTAPTAGGDKASLARAKVCPDRPRTTPRAGPMGPDAPDEEQAPVGIMRQNSGRSRERS